MGAVIWLMLFCHLLIITTLQCLRGSSPAVHDSSAVPANCFLNVFYSSAHHTALAFTGQEEMQGAGMVCLKSCTVHHSKHNKLRDDLICCFSVLHHNGLFTVCVFGGFPGDGSFILPLKNTTGIGEGGTLDHITSHLMEPGQEASSCKADELAQMILLAAEPAASVSTLTLVNRRIRNVLHQD